MFESVRLLRARLGIAKNDDFEQCPLADARGSVT